MDKKLLFCPFCGGKAVLEVMSVRKGFEVDIHCNGCLASVHTITYDRLTEAIDNAIAAWNTRTPEIVRCGECEHLEIINKAPTYAKCAITNRVFKLWDEDTRSHFCSYGKRKEQNDES